MGKTYRRDSDRKFKDFKRGNSKPKKIKYDQDEPKCKKQVKFYTDDVDNED